MHAGVDVMERFLSVDDAGIRKPHHDAFRHARVIFHWADLDVESLVELAAALS